METIDDRLHAVEEANRQMAQGGCFAPALFIVVAMAITIAMGSCCTCKHVVVGNDRDSTNVHTEWRIDTLKEVDSVFVSIREKGDTVWMEKYKYKYVYKYRDVAVHDTVTMTETVEVPVEVVKEVPRKKSWFEKMYLLKDYLLFLPNQGNIHMPICLSRS